MGKWFTGTVGALVLLALTSLIGAVLKGPIDEFVNESRLDAAIQLSPWVAKPDLGVAGQKNPASTETDDTDKLLRDLAIRQSSIGDYGIAVMNVENGSSGTVKEINVRLEPSYGTPEVMVIDPAGDVRNLGEVDRIRMPDMKPGDRAKIYVWDNFSTYDITDYFKTYSSEGEFRLNYAWAETREFEYRSSIGTFLDDYAWATFVAACVLLCVMVGIVCAVYTEYLKGLFVSPDLREEEANKFLADPKKFQIDSTAAQAAWNVYLGRMKKEQSVQNPDSEGSV